MKIIIIIIFIFIVIIELTFNIKNRQINNFLTINNDIFNIFDYDPINLNKYESDNDVEFLNFKKSIYIKDTYGFFIYDNKYNIIEPNKIYSFNISVNIKIIKIKK